jgi:hypothetical protein
VAAQTPHLMDLTVFQQQSVPHGQMASLQFCQAIVKLNAENLLQLQLHGFHAVQLCAIHRRLESIAQVTTNARTGIAAALLLSQRLA